MIGRRPDAAFGNSDGDRQMLEYTGAGEGARLAMLVLHDDATREYAYGPAQGLPDTKVGTFTQALYDEAKEEKLDSDQHEERLEADFLVRVAAPQLMWAELLLSDTPDDRGTDASLVMTTRENDAMSNRRLNDNRPHVSAAPEKTSWNVSRARLLAQRS